MRALRVMLLTAVLSTSLLVPTAVFAGDGEVITRGTDVAGEVYITGGRPRINFQNLGDCPGGLGQVSCWVEVRFLYQCVETWCFGYSVSPWYSVPAGQDFYQGPICADGRNKWEVQTRLHYSAATIQTIEMWGQLETSLSGLSGISKLIPKFMYDVTIGAGLRLGTKIQTLNTSNGTSSERHLGSSAGFIQGPSSC